MKFNYIGTEDSKYIYGTTLQNEQQFIYAGENLEYLNIVGSGTKITLKLNEQSTEQNGEAYFIRNKVVPTRDISRYGVSALENKWVKETNEIVILAQDFLNVVGTVSGTVDTTSDAYVTLTTNAPMSVDVELTRDGLSYSDEASLSSPVQPYLFQSHMEESMFQLLEVQEIVSQDSLPL